MKKIFSIIVLLLFVAVTTMAATEGIDRKALVGRNNPVVQSVDTLASLSVGNGGFAVTVDATGMQTFPEYYRGGVPLGTQSDWGWHSFGNPEHLKIEESYKEEDFGHGHKELYATEFREDGRPRRAAQWYRMNPHRLHLGCNGLEVENLKPSDLKDIHQQLDMWTGMITSQFTIANSRYHVSAVCHPQRDMMAWRVQAEDGSRVGACLRFAYPTGKHTDDACDWIADKNHRTELVSSGAKSALLRRTIDSTIYYVSLKWDENAVLREKAPNYWVLTAEGGLLTYTCEYLPVAEGAGSETFSDVAALSASHWQTFWSEGAAVDFSQCTDARAPELERRVVLSQYLLAIQCCGNTPPQETGLTYNSWFGKFHMEMIWWHQAWLPLWGHADRLERTLRWYLTAAPVARRIAQRQGFRGVRWMKMTDPSGEEAPSKVGSYLVWQQPHLIYLAELVYRSMHSEPRTSHLASHLLDSYGELIDSTATWMADFVTYDAVRDRYIIKGVIPAQETLKASVTYNPPFELSYWHYALQTAQQWRQRRGLERNALWDTIIQKLSPLAAGTAPDGTKVYLAAESAPDTYSTQSLISDHPAVLGAVGVLPASPLADAAVMRSTAAWIWDGWNWDRTWGWDYPMVAMNAARLGDGERAVDALLMDKRTNTYLPNGHNYQDGRLRCYLPGNGGLLTAVAMMCAGWEGNTGVNPGFPDNGRWNVRWEGLLPMP